jgi:hypothetical protein
MKSDETPGPSTPSTESRATLQLTNVIITGIGSRAGGAVACDACDVRSSNTSISDCWASCGGALILTSCSLSLFCVTFFGCEAKSAGGAIDCSDPISVAMSNIKFVRCVADNFGGAVAFSNAPHVFIE